MLCALPGLDGLDSTNLLLGGASKTQPLRSDNACSVAHTLSEGRAHAFAFYVQLTCFGGQPTGVTRRTQCGARGAGSWSSTTSVETQARALPRSVQGRKGCKQTHHTDIRPVRLTLNFVRVCCYPSYLTVAALALHLNSTWPYGITPPQRPRLE